MPDRRKQQDDKTIVDHLVRFPRITRILIAGVFAVAVALAISPVIDEIYLRHFFSESTVTLPGFISGGAGILMYFIGWAMIVGMAGNEPESKRLIWLYLIIGLIAVAVCIIWVGRLIILGGLT